MPFSDTINLIQTLKEIGLSAKEANTYLTLLMYGPNPASVVASKAEMHRATCYGVLQKLMQKGFIQQSNRKKVTLFTAVEPNYILGALRDQKTKMDSKIENLRRNISQFEKIRCDFAPKPKVLFYEGSAGIKNILEDTLNAKETVRAYASLDELTAILPDYYPEYNRRRSHKNISMRAIYPANEISFKHKLRDQKEKRESRLIPPEFDFHLDILIYNNCVAITSTREMFGILINSKQMADAQKNIFDLIWSGTQKYDQHITSTMKKGGPLSSLL